MKYAIGFLAAFIVVGALVAYLRFSGDTPHGETHDHNTSPDMRADAHDHGNDHGKHEENGDPTWGSDVKQDLENRVDPVSGDAVGTDHAAHHHHVYHGFLIHFADEDTAERFRRNPVGYTAKLELEPTPDGGAIKVDASSYQTPDLPADCPFCGMPLDENSDIYILHRNFKIFFG